MSLPELFVYDKKIFVILVKNTFIISVEYKLRNLNTLIVPIPFINPYQSGFQKQISNPKTAYPQNVVAK